MAPFSAHSGIPRRACAPHRENESMLFNSIPFLVFAPIFFVGYFLLRGSGRLLWLLGASYFFYGWWDWRFLSLLALSTGIDYSIGRLMETATDDRHRKTLLTLSVCSNLGILGVFKYFDFFSGSLQALLASLGLSVPLPLLNVVLPVGISFYTFQTMSYTIDLYRREMPAEHSLLRFAVYVAMFPQLVAGPIVRAKSLLPQIRSMPAFDLQRFTHGFELVLWGFFLKLCLADNAAQVVDPRFRFPDLFDAGSHIVGTLAFSLQIYGDFAGYSLIAIGLGRMLGFDFGINFNRPYFASSFSDFWRRWHISLSSWLRDYLYISLGGNQHGVVRTYRNLMLTMLLGGLWHGAGLTFVVWGFLHGSYLVLQRAVQPAYASLMKLLRVPRPIVTGIAILTVFALTNVAWIFFRADSLSSAMTILGRIASFSGWEVGAGEERIAIAKTALIGAIVMVVDYLGTRPGVREVFGRSGRLRFAAALAICWFIAVFGAFEGASFIYFQF